MQNPADIAVSRVFYV